MGIMVSDAAELAPVGGGADSVASVACWSPRELADQLSISTATLRNWRSQGRGPKYVKAEGCVRYPIETVIQWLISGDSDGDARNVGGTS